MAYVHYEYKYVASRYVNEETLYHMSHKYVAYVGYE